MGMKVNQPRMFSLSTDRNEQYLNGLRDCVNGDAQIVLCILIDNKDCSDLVKKFCCIDRPVSTQMIVSRTLNKQRNLLSVAMKIAIQMNYKTGGIVWSVQILLKGTMTTLIVGIDTYESK